MTMTERIKIAHGRYCSTWETWETVERDHTGRIFAAQWSGCQHCGVAILHTGAND